MKKDLYYQGGLIADDQFLFYQKSIKDPVHSQLEIVTIDGEGGKVVPGFIDIQINGAIDIDFADPKLTAEMVETVSKFLLEVRLLCSLFSMVVHHTVQRL